MLSSAQSRALVGCLLGALLVTGCTGGQASTPPPPAGAPEAAAPGPGETPPSALSREQEAQLLAERQDSYLSCMRGEGIRVERTDEPGQPWELDPGGLDRETFLRINTSCLEQRPEVEPAPATREEISALYDLNLEAKKCLEARGVTVSEPPSREQWIEDFNSVEVGPWTPFDGPAAFAYVDECPDPDIYDVYGIDPYDTE